MDSIEELVQEAQGLAMVKYLSASGAALTLYDYLLMFDDEVRYVWRGRKTWIFYLYITNRVLLVSFQFWTIYYISSPRHSKTFCLWRYYTQVATGSLFLFFSEIFIMLRVYAVTSKNKILAVYFGSMALARFAVSLASNLVGPLTIMDLPPAPIDAFNLCGFVVDFRFSKVPHSLGTAFDLSAFLIIIWYSYRNRGLLKFSGLVRAIVTEASIYFIAMVTAQTCIQVSIGLMGSLGQQLFYLIYGIINPILTVRFAVSLKRSADPEGGEDWRLKHFSSVYFVDDSGDTQVLETHQGIEMDHLSGRVQTTKLVERY